MQTENFTVSETDGWKAATLGKISFANAGAVSCRIAFTDDATPPAETIQGEPFKPDYVRLVEATQRVWFKVKGNVAAVISES